MTALRGSRSCLQASHFMREPPHGCRQDGLPHNLLGRGCCGRRNHIGHILAAMARIATHVGLAIRELRIDVVYHFHHHARHQLLGILVAGIVTLNVAEIAPLTESSLHAPHHRTYLVFLQNFQILMRRLWAACPTLFGSRS